MFDKQDMMMMNASDRLLAMFKQEDLFYYKTPNKLTGITTSNKRFVALRSSMMNWCFKVVRGLKLRLLCVEITMNYVDRYCAIKEEEIINDDDNNFEQRYTLLVITSLYIATKIHAKAAISLQLLQNLSKNMNHTNEEIQCMEMDILQTLQWRMNPPTAYSLAWEYLSLVDNNTERNLRKKIDKYQDIVCHILPLVQKTVYIRASTVAYYAMVASKLQFEDSKMVCLGQLIRKNTSSTDTMIEDIMFQLLNQNFCQKTQSSSTENSSQQQQRPCKRMRL